MGLPEEPPIQLAEDRAGVARPDAKATHALARQGISGSGGGLPHLDLIQRSFDRHDAGHVKAHAGGPAAEASCTEVDPAAAELVARARRGGAPLDEALQSQLEAALGVGLDDVRIHTGADADAAARALHAHAFAVGDDVFFRAGAYAPEHRDGQQLIAHEVAHTVQARGATPATSAGTPVSQPGDPLERAADEFADAFVRQVSAGQLAPPIAGATRAGTGGETAAGSVQANTGAETPGVPARPQLAPVATVAPAAAASIFRFYPPEHVKLGDEATGNETTDIEVQFEDGSKHKLTFGQIVALADCFDSVADIKAKAALKPAIAVQYALSWKLGIGSEPAGHDDIKRQVRDHILEILATNMDHFGDEAKGNYKKEHTEALIKAFEAGAGNDQAAFGEAVALEAFSQHYLSDLFAGGHIRTPRREIKDWYEAHFPKSNHMFVTNMANRIVAYCEDQGAIPWWVPQNSVVPKVSASIFTLGGAAIANTSIGDIVGAAHHNLDNQGLQVVSDVDENGNTVMGGYHWESKGDDHLKESATTEKMAVSAMAASRKELDAARAAGKQASGGKYMTKSDLLAARDAAIKGMQPYRAERFLPREDKGNAKNKQYNWRWGSLDGDLAAEIGRLVKTGLTGILRGKAAELPEKKIVDEDVLGGYKHLHMELPIRAAILDYCDHLDANPLQGMVEILGNVPAQIPPPKPHVGAWDSEEG